jgi:hypothetical protein
MFCSPWLSNSTKEPFPTPPKPITSPKPASPKSIASSLKSNSFKSIAPPEPLIVFHRSFFDYTYTPKDRIDVTKKSLEELKQIKVRAFYYEVCILHDLIYNDFGPGGSQNSDNMQGAMWAAELYMVYSEDAQKDFLDHIFKTDFFFRRFMKGMIANNVSHRLSLLLRNTLSTSPSKRFSLELFPNMSLEKANAIRKEANAIRKEANAKHKEEKAVIMDLIHKYEQSTEKKSFRIPKLGAKSATHSRSFSLPNPTKSSTRPQTPEQPKMINN